MITKEGKHDKIIKKNRSRNVKIEEWTMDKKEGCGKLDKKSGMIKENGE